MNAWCDILGIEPPNLERVKEHRDANTYAKLIVVLLESGTPMTLDAVAHRFQEAGVADAAVARRSLSRCKPGRAPVYRDRDLYALDPHDQEARLWVSRLGLRPPRPAMRVVRPAPPPLPSDAVPVTVEELREAFDDTSLNSWSNQRLALAVLEAHGRSLKPEEAVQFVSDLTRWHGFRAEGVVPRRGCPVLLVDGRWELDEGIESHLRPMRTATRNLIRRARAHRARQPDPEVFAAQRKASERRREARRAELAAHDRAILVGFPADAPRAVALVDVRARSVQTFGDDALDALLVRLATFDQIAALAVRPLLQALGFDWESRPLAELAPPQKTKQLNKRGRTLKITTEMLISGSCGIRRPLGDRTRMAAYLHAGQYGRLRRRLESDAKSLAALYAYGRLQGAVRLRWGFLDEMIPAPWSDWDEARLFDMKKEALEENLELEVVIGSAPGWADPWARARRVFVVGDGSGWSCKLVEESGAVVDDRDVQAARLVR